MAKFRVSLGGYNGTVSVEADYFEISGYNLLLHSSTLGLIAAFHDWESVERMADDGS